MAQKSNFVVRGGADFSEITKGLAQTQKHLGSFQTGLSKTLKGIGIAFGSIAIGSLIKSSVKEAMTVESSINQLSRIMGESSNVFNTWAQTQAKAFGMARSEAFKYGATYSNLISTFSSGTKETEKLTTDLLKASAVTASATGRTMEDTMERIRSGLLGNTESIEDLGINVNVAMLESSKSFAKFANGKSWNQLSFQTQQQIRLMAILEQANVKYGDSLAGTTATKQMMFVATLKNIQLNIGQAFLPIYNVVLPALTALASKIEAVTANLAVFSQSLFGKSVQASVSSTESQTEAITDYGNAAEAAGKKAKGATAGIDELTMLGSNSSSGSGSGSSGGTSGGSTTTTPTTVNSEAAEGSLTKAFASIKEAAQPTIDALGRLGDALKPFTTFVATGLKSFWTDVLVPIGKWVLGKGLPSLIDSVTNLIDDIDWTKITEALKKFNKAIAPFAIAIGTGLVLFISDLSKVLSPIISTTVDAIAKALSLFADAISNLSPSTVEQLGYALGTFFTSLALAKTLAGISTILTAIGTGLTNFSLGAQMLSSTNLMSLSIIFGGLVNDLDLWVTTKIDEKFGEIWENVLIIFANVGLGALTGFTFGGIPGAIIGGLAGALLAAVNTLDLKEVWEALKNSISQAINVVFNWDTAKELFSGMIDSFKNALNGNNIVEIGANIVDGIFNGIGAALLLVFEPIIDLFNGIILGVMDLFGIHSPSTVFAEIGGYLIAGLKKGITDAWNDFITFIGGLPEKIVTKFGDIKTGFVTKGKNILEGIQKGWNDNLSAFVSWISAKPGSILTSFGNIKTGFINKGSDIISGIKQGWTDGWNDFKTWLSDLPSKIVTGIGSLKEVGKDLINSFVDGLKSISIPKLKVDIGTSKTSVLGKEISIPKLDVSWYANGGFPSAGELFVGNENGIEMMGRMGNQNVVANNNQITDGIKQAVIEAMMISNGNNGKDIVVESNTYFGDDLIYRAVKRAQESNNRRYSTTEILV